MIGSAQNIAKWEVQLRKGVLELVVMLSLREREQYGFELINGVAKRASLDLPEGTLYPLMLRLSAENLVSSRMEPGDGRAPRKYYALTPHGREVLSAMIRSWTELSFSVQRMVAGAAA